ncbi:MAG: hypothetical protein NTX50_04085 [Candidatus Sumerlaeota bacterium]|nr:hypothetical protein [Candidatus Sumerlaeota bacterium]
MNPKQKFERIIACEQMCNAGMVATAYYFSLCQTQPELLDKSLCRIKDFQDCHQDLETTYLIRIFAEFEATLRDYWENACSRQKRPIMEMLMNRIISRCQVWPAVAEKAHMVREYRNSLMHGGAAAPVTLSEARSYLCQFLSHLPYTW